MQDQKLSNTDKVTRILGTLHELFDSLAMELSLNNNTLEEIINAMQANIQRKKSMEHGRHHIHLATLPQTSPMEIICTEIIAKTFVGLAAVVVEAVVVITEPVVVDIVFNQIIVTTHMPSL